MNVNDQLGPGQTFRQLAVLLLELAHFPGKWIMFGLGAASMRGQAQIALLAPVGEMRRVEAIAAKQGTDRAGLLAESASAKMRFLYPAVYWRRFALTTTSGSGIVLVSPGATLRSASLRSASLRSAPGETKTAGNGETPFTCFFMGISFSALYSNYRTGRRLTDLGTEGRLTSN